jgi:hypothetical protein
MALIDCLKQAARLAGIVGMAAGSLLLSYCSNTQTPPDGRVPDLRRPDAGPGRDIAVDARGRDASVDRQSRDSALPPDKTSPDTRRPDARLWDVLCE